MRIATTPLRRCPSVSLAELREEALLQTRVDRKYVLPKPMTDRVLASLDHGVAVLRIEDRESFLYESLYFDTPDLQSYTRTALRRPNRFKVRIRTYMGTGLCMFEVKCKDGRSATVKHRTEHPFSARGRLTEEAARFVDAVTQTPVSERLHPMLITNFWRTTLLDRRDGSRTTIDRNLCWRSVDGTVTDVQDHVVLETKSLGSASAVDRWLWRHGHRPTSMSKYCVGMALHNPTLPANKWNRLLRATFGWEPERAPGGPNVPATLTDSFAPPACWDV